VEAGLVLSIFDWKYSSLRAYLDPAPRGFVNVDPILHLLGGSGRYLQFLHEYDPSEPESVITFMPR
jgi:hypothetical protein